MLSLVLAIGAYNEAEAEFEWSRQEPLSVPQPIEGSDSC